MTSRGALPLAAALALSAALAGCSIGGSGDSASEKASNKRGTVLDCLNNEKQVSARPVGPESIQIGAPRTGPMIRFYLTQGEAEAAQLEGRAEGSEHIGSALLFVNAAHDDLLKKVEACLDDLES